MFIQYTYNNFIKANVHLGHNKKYWNNKIRVFLFAKRQNIFIINIFYTIIYFKIALSFLVKSIYNYNKILFISQTSLHSSLLKNHLESLEQFYFFNKWIGGFLSNFKSFYNLIYKLNSHYKRYKKLKYKYLKFLGILELKRIPSVLILLDHYTLWPHKEAFFLNIPSIAIVDTNFKLLGVNNYIIPGNDDSMYSINLYLILFKLSILKGFKLRKITFINNLKKEINFILKKNLHP